MSYKHIKLQLSSYISCIIIIADYFEMLHMNFGGNPIIQELLQSSDTDIDKLLQIDSFPAQFRNNNPKLQKYMDINRYQRLVSYVTVLGSPEDKKKAYKYPLVASQILSVDNILTQQALLAQKPIIIQVTQIQEKWVEREVDQCDSQYCSSNGSSNQIDFQDMIDSAGEEQVISAAKNKKGQLRERASIDNIVSPDLKSKKNSKMKQSSTSITSDDFPMADDGKKKIKIRQKIQRKVTKQFKPLLEQLFDYFNGDIDYTLAGYICKILEILLKKHPSKIMRYIFRTKIYKNMLNHVESYSVCEFFMSLILNAEKQYEHLRQQLLESILKKTISPNIDKNQFIRKNHIYIINDIINKLDPINQPWHSKIVEFLYREQILLSIREICFKSIQDYKCQQSALHLLLILLKKTQLPQSCGATNQQKTIQSFEQQEQQEKVIQLKKLLKNKTQICFKDFISKVWDLFVCFSCRQPQKEPIPSSITIRSLEITNYLLHDDLYWSRIQLSNQESAFKILCDICKKMPKNNILHNQVFDIFKVVVHNAEQQPKLVSKMFQQKALFTFLFEALNHKDILYRGQSILLCHLIKNTHSPILKQIRSKPVCKWNKIQQALSSEIQKTNKSLAGFSIKKNTKPIVTFKKQQIFERYSCFLKGEIPDKMNDSEESDEDQVQDLTSSRGSTQWNDWNDFNNYNADELDK